MQTIARTKNGDSMQTQFQRSLMNLAVASACSALAMAAHAQEADAQTNAVTDDSARVIVTGLRASMRSTLNLKRNSDGIVDGIVAEDMGKFPDTNLAESLQRISGVSIDRSNGEGQKVTVRGLGPDFNLVLLNGRQMPTTDLSDLSGRSFDFSNLASESISQLQVYKTGRADSPTGGIGATINVVTGRPFDNPGLHASVGLKAVKDTSNDHVPEAVKGKSVTPEVSGIYSNTSADGRFGVSLSASYQSRDSGFNRAGLFNGRALLDSTEHELQRCRRPAAAYQWTVDLPVPPGQGADYHPGLHLFGKQGTDQAERAQRVVRPDADLDQHLAERPCGQPTDLCGSLSYAAGYLGGGQRLRHQDEEQIARFQRCLESQSRPEAGI
jgi:outer membrane receptor protein involved in Fe transport